MDAEGCCERSQDLRATRRVSGVCGFGVECGGGAWIRRVFRDQPDSSCPQPTASALFSLSSVSAAGGSLAFAAPCSAAVHAGGWFRAFSSGQRPVVPIRPPKVRPGDPAMMAAAQQQHQQAQQQAQQPPPQQQQPQMPPGSLPPPQPGSLAQLQPQQPAVAAGRKTGSDSGGSGGSSVGVGGGGGGGSLLLLLLQQQ